MKWVSKPNFKQQHRGITPGGPQDRFSCAFGNLMLQNTIYTPAVEVEIHPTEFTFPYKCRFVVSGAVSKLYLNGESINRYQVYDAKRNDLLRINPPTLGLRNYICITEDKVNVVGICRKSFYPYNTWYPPRKTIRVIKGPEFDYINDIDQLKQNWYIKRANGMGIILCSSNSIQDTKYDILSSPVNDGTVQLTQSGPIILMRARQTIGGYPRILNVINCDVDVLAQMRERQSFKFKIISIQEACEIEDLQQAILQQAEKDFESP